MSREPWRWLRTPEAVGIAVILVVLVAVLVMWR